MLELTNNWRAQKDSEFAEFIKDLRIVKNGDKHNFKMYKNNECRKSICWTNRTRKLINNNWILKEAKNKKIIIVKNIKVFVGLPVISKKTTTIENCKIIKVKEEEDLIILTQHELVNNEIKKKNMTLKL